MKAARAAASEYMMLISYTDVMSQLGHGLLTGARPLLVSSPSYSSHGQAQVPSLWLTPHRTSQLFIGCRLADVRIEAW